MKGDKNIHLFMLFKLKKKKQDHCHELFYIKSYNKKTLTWKKLLEECNLHKLRAI